MKWKHNFHFGNVCVLYPNAKELSINGKELFPIDGSFNYGGNPWKTNPLLIGRKGCYIVKTNDYVKYLTQTFVKYFEQPKEERRRARLQKKETKDAFLFRWFGWVGMAPYMVINKIRRKGKLS